MMDCARETISVEEAGRRLGIGRTTSFKLARQGSLCEGVPVLKLGRKLRVPVRGLERVLEGREAA